MKLRSVGIAGVLMLLGAQGAQAAQQCVGAVGTTTYGARTVTVTGPGCSTYAPSAPFAAPLAIFSGGACEMTFDAPISTASIVAGVDSLDGSVMTASLDGSPYAIQSSDIISSPIPGAGFSPGNGIVISGSGVTTDPVGGGSEGSGYFGFRTAAPAAITSLAISQSTGGSGTLLQVCFDDNAAVAPTAIPTLSEWAMILLASLLAGGAALTLYRRRQAA